MDDTGKVELKQDSESQAKQNDKPATNGHTAVEAHNRDDDTPSSILEKGIIYFFIRGRVGIDSPSKVDDIARSYMILRPLPHGAKIGDGEIGDAAGKCRLLALPKKVLPLSGKDKFMVFVEKSKTSFKELKDDFMSGSDYNTQTVGARHTPPVTPMAEGVYALTTTGRESHLAYMITIPQELSEVQKDIGLREQGSFITSTKNPEYAGPANTNLDQGPGFSKEILQEFRGLRWLPLQPKFLEYENAQFLLIGESDPDHALEPQSGDKDKDDPKEELEKLEGEDEIRIKNLKGKFLMSSSVLHMLTFYR